MDYSGVRMISHLVIEAIAIIPEKNHLPVDDRGFIRRYNRDMATKVLLIGHGMFHDGLKRILSEQSQMSVVGTASTWDEARELLAQLQPDVLIVEQEAADLYEDNLASLMDMQDHAQKIIYLTLAESRMIIHDRQKVEGATIDHLFKALQVNTVAP